MARIIPDHILEEVRSRTSIVDVISSRIPLKQSGSTFKACCPFHREKTPSFIVNPTRESFKCFGCGEGGDVFSFLMKHDGMTFTDAVRMLADRCGVEIAYDDDDGSGIATKRMLALHAEVAAFYRRCLEQTKSAAVARDYLASRGLGGEVAERFKIGYAPLNAGALEQFAEKAGYSLEEVVAAGLATALENPRAGRNLHDRFAGRLMFPICDTQGRVIAFSGRVLDPSQSPAKYVNSPETDIFKKSRVLYGLDQAQRKIVAAPHREAIVCEGQIDVIRCHACGFDRAVASQGTAFSEEHAKLLKRYADSAVLLFDGDEPGRKAAIRTGAILFAEGIPVRVASLEQGEDPDSFLRKHPPEAFQKVLDDAIGLVPFHVAHLRKLEADPRSEGAVGRIAAGVLTTIAGCRNEIHKARLLQETADLLEIPEAALESELAGLEEALRRRQESMERREAARAEFANRPVGRSSAPRPSRDRAGAGAASSARPQVAPPPKTAPHERLDLSICELLVHHFEERDDVADLLATMLPPWLLPEGVCRRVAEAFYVSRATGADEVAQLLERDAEASEFLGALAVRPDRSGVHENFQELDLARDLVLSAWRRWCAKRRAELTPRDAAADTPEAVRRRMDFMVREKQLKNWATGEAMIRKLSGEADSVASESEQGIAQKTEKPDVDADAGNERLEEPEEDYFAPPEEDPDPSWVG
ncbi:MAG: DNA primase [Kiritimatiellia bacterium]|jgi:DNA primase catalytic core